LFTGVVVTSIKFIASNNETVNHKKYMTRINHQQKIFASVVDASEQVIASVGDTSDKH
jgi:hypothetical protein